MCRSWWAVQRGDEADRLDVEAGGVHLGQAAADIIEQQAVARDHQLDVPLDRFCAEGGELFGLLGREAWLAVNETADRGHVDVRVNVDGAHGRTHRFCCTPRPVISDSITSPSRR